MSYHQENEDQAATVKVTSSLRARWPASKSSLGPELPGDRTPAGFLSLRPAARPGTMAEAGQAPRRLVRIWLLSRQVSATEQARTSAVHGQCLPPPGRSRPPAAAPQAQDRTVPPPAAKNEGGLMPPHEAWTEGRGIVSSACSPEGSSCTSWRSGWTGGEQTGLQQLPEQDSSPSGSRAGRKHSRLQGSGTHSQLPPWPWVLRRAGWLPSRPL